MTNANKQETGKNVSYPATTARAMQVDPESNVIREIVETINPLIADGFALYEKTKNFSLMPAVSHNRDYQLLFDEQAREIFDSIDSLAELLRQIGATTVRSISHTGELQGVENDNGDVLSPGKMVEELIAGNEQIASSLRAAGKLCEKMRETTIGNILRDILDQTERRIINLSKKPKTF